MVGYFGAADMPLHRHALTDEQWEKLEPLLPKRGRPGHDARTFVNAVLFVAKTGVAWRDLPERFGNWNSLWRRFSRWSKAGRWEKLSEALGDPDLSELHLDSTSVRAHQQASTGRRLPGEDKKPPTPGAASAAAAAG